MASDKEDYTIALEKWQSLHDEGLFSDPGENRSVAVLLPYDHHDHDGYTGVESFEALREEAYGLATTLANTKHNVTLAIDAEETDFKEVLQDPKIASVVVIGHGGLSAVHTADPAKRLDWADISRMTTHLKTGKFLQRFCGGLWRDFNAPLGTFAMDSHSKVYAPVGKTFSPRNLDDKENNKIIPVTRKTKLGYHAVKMAFPKEKKPGLS